MKSCLKCPTPPFSPEPPAPPTPVERPWRPQLQKSVSFCEDDHLEEVFEVDDWDRSPAPVTPRLSYEDVLELKQLRLSLPRPAPPPTYRQPFTTSLPTAYTDASSSSSSRSFPYSRFATQPSQTPSKWKNRGTTPPPSAILDPEILPYLDAVPIRLLPLLDTPPVPEPPSPQLLAETEPIVRAESPSHPESPPPHSSSGQTPTTPTSSAPQPLSNPLSSPPRSTCSPPPSHSPSAPATAPVSPPTPNRRLPTFSFVPLLPVQSASAPPPPEPTRPLSAAQRRINMTFLPLLAPPSPPPVPPPSLPESTPRLDSTASPTQQNEKLEDEDRDVESEFAPTPTLAPIPEPLPPSTPSSTASTASTGSFGDSSLGYSPESTVEVAPDADADEPEGYNDLPARALSPTDLSTPALSSASESDTDEHDGDTDAETDDDRQPSTAAGYGGHAHPVLAEYEYFAARLQPSSAGHTPPLSSIYPEVHAELDAGDGDGDGDGELGHARASAEHGLGMGVDMGISELPLSMQIPLPGGTAALKKVKLAALPSPALPPPSPFSLYPSDAAGSPFVPREAREAARTAVVVEERTVLAVESGAREVGALEVGVERLAVAERAGGGEQVRTR